LLGVSQVLPHHRTERLLVEDLHIAANLPQAGGDILGQRRLACAQHAGKPDCEATRVRHLVSLVPNSGKARRYSRFDSSSANLPCWKVKLLSASVLPRVTATTIHLVPGRISMPSGAAMSASSRLK